MTFGEKVKKEAETNPKKKLNVSVVLGFYLSGPGCDQLDYYQLIMDALEEQGHTDCEMTKADYKIYYSEQDNKTK